MKFSIVTPVYNVEKYVRQCIESVIQQTFADFELILVDDGSMDASGKICDEYAQKDSRIRVFHKSNSGLIATRCYGIREALGEYVVSLDSDDMLALNALEKIAEKIQDNSYDMVLYRWQRFVNVPEMPPVINEQPVVLEGTAEIIRKILSSSAYNSLCLKAIRREKITVLDYGEYTQIRHGEDLLQTIRIASHCNSAILTSDVLYFYRTNPMSISNAGKAEKRLWDSLLVRENVYQTLLQLNVFSEEDFYSYKGYCISIFMDSVLGVLQTLKHKEVVEIFKQVQKNKYYEEFLSKGEADTSVLGKKKILWSLFRKRRFGLLRLVVKSFYFIKRA